MMTLPLHVLPLLLFAQTGLDDDKNREAFNAGASWASAGVTAKCMLAMFEDSTNPLLKTPDGRQAARNKAQVVAGLALRQLRISDEYHRLVQIDEKTYIDYYKNGLITEEEYNDKVVKPAQDYEDMVASTADIMVRYRECDFFRGRESSETLRRAMKLIQTSGME